MHHTIITHMQIFLLRNITNVHWTKVLNVKITFYLDCLIFETMSRIKYTFNSFKVSTNCHKNNTDTYFQRLCYVYTMQPFRWYFIDSLTNLYSILMLLILLYNVLFENVIYYIIIWPVDPLICSTFSAGWPKGDDHEKRNIWTNFRQTGVTIRHHERRRIIQMLPWSEFIDSSETVQRNSITRFKTQKLCMKIVMLSVKICCFGTTSMYFYVNNKHYANFFLSDFFFVGILCLVEPLQRNICIHM